MMNEKRLSELKLSVQKAFDWILNEAPDTGSACDLARIILWLYNSRTYPNSRGLNACDSTRVQWAVDLIQYCVMTRKEPQQWFGNGQELMAKIKEQYGRNE